MNGKLVNGIVFVYKNLRFDQIKIEDWWIWSIRSFYSDWSIDHPKYL